MRTVRSSAGWLLGAMLLAGSGPAAAQDVRVTSNLPPSGYIDPDFRLEVRLAGALAPGERIAVIAGVEDVTALLVATDDGYRYPSELLGLPVGRSDLVVFRVDAEGVWDEAMRSEMRVRSGLGVEEVRWKPKLDLTFTAQPGYGENPVPAQASDVPEVLDGTFQLGMELEHRDFAFDATSVLVGTSEDDRRLRSRELQDQAPTVDLSSYRIDHKQGPVEVSLGHVRAGSQRLLIDGFGARGATATIRPSSRLDLAMGATAGSQSVGWSNLVGLGNPDHRVLSANVGVEALARPGALRMEVGWMNGSILPRSGFNQGAITDAETSHGLAVRVLAQGLDRRLRLDAGWAQSTFDNPADPALSQGQAVVEVAEATNNARYLDANLDLVRGLKLGGGRTAMLSVGYKHERIDPLYRTVATNVRPDNLEDQFDVRADIAGVAVTGMFASAEDNLDGIASILTSNTDRRSVNVAVPLPRIVAGTTWLPALTYRNDRTHQFGVALPENGEFSATHVPDQVSVNQSLSLDWRGRKVSFRYQLNHSHQDNRQEGREGADFTTLASGFGLGLDPLRSLRVGVDLNLDRSDDLGADARDNARTVGVNLTWRPLTRSTFTVRFSDTFKDDEARTREQAGRSLDVKWSSQIPKASTLGGTYFVRFNRNETGRIDRLRDLVQDRTRWTVNLGASLSIQRR